MVNSCCIFAAQGASQVKQQLLEQQLQGQLASSTTRGGTSALSSLEGSPAAPSKLAQPVKLEGQAQMLITPTAHSAAGTGRSFAPPPPPPPPPSKAGLPRTPQGFKTPPPPPPPPARMGAMFVTPAPPSVVPRTAPPPPPPPPPPSAAGLFLLATGLGNITKPDLSLTLIEGGGNVDIDVAVVVVCCYRLVVKFAVLKTVRIITINMVCFQHSAWCSNT